MKSYLVPCSVSVSNRPEFVELQAYARVKMLWVQVYFLYHVDAVIKVRSP